MEIISDGWGCTWTHHPPVVPVERRHSRDVSFRRINYGSTKPSRLPCWFPSLDNVCERPLAPVTVVYSHRWKHLLCEAAPPPPARPVAWFESGWGWCFQRATCPSSRWLRRCSPSSSALLRVRLRLSIQAARSLANGLTVTSFNRLHGRYVFRPLHRTSSPGFAPQPAWSPAAAFWLFTRHLHVYFRPG